MSSIELILWPNKMPFVFVTLFVILSLGVYLISNALRPGLRTIRGPWQAKLTPLWRMYMVSRGSAPSAYRALHEKYGHIVRTAPNAVDISYPPAIQKIYGINSKFLKTDFYTPFGVVYDGKIMDSMFSTRSQEEHRMLKRSVASKYSMSTMKTFEYLVDPCTDLFAENMLDLQGQIVDLGAWAQWYAFDAIGSITFGSMFGFMKRRTDVDNVIAGIEAGLVYGAIVGQMPWLHKLLLGNLTTRKLFAKVLGDSDPIPIVTKLVEESIEIYDANAGVSSGRHDFLASLRQQKGTDGTTMDQRELMNHLMNNLLAGSDTTGISLRAIFYYLMKDRRTYVTLQKEIDQAQADGKLSKNITFAESLQLEYLHACIKEALRMHPGVGLPLERVVPAEGLEICGETLPAGTIVGVNAHVIHHDPELFGEDAGVFRPERWLGEENAAQIKKMENHLLTFGAGVRTCVGKNISLMEMGKLVPQVLRQFDLEWASDEAEWTVRTFWFAKQTGLHVRFKARSQ